MHNNLHIKTSGIKFNSVPDCAHLPLRLLVGTSAVCSRDEGRRFPGVGLFQQTREHILTMSCMNNQLKDVFINHDGLEGMGIYRHNLHNYVDYVRMKEHQFKQSTRRLIKWYSWICDTGPRRSKPMPQYILLPSILLDLLQPFGLFGEEAPQQKI